MTITSLPSGSFFLENLPDIDILTAKTRLLVTIKPSDRPWQMPFAAALANGLPLFVGAYFGHLEYGLISSLGGLAFLYLPDTPMAHRMVSLMAAALTPKLSVARRPALSPATRPWPSGWWTPATLMR